jgi:hypothetical protein
MSRIRPVGISAITLVTVFASLVRAEDISAKKLFIKDNTDPAKRQVQVQSSDLGVQLSEVGDPGTNGASLHVYSATDDFCVILPAGPEWLNKTTQWKYKSKTTKNSVQVKNGKVAVKIKSGVTYTLSDNGTQVVVNAQLQFGTGTRYCMRCNGTQDEAFKFLGKVCAAAPCDPEPSSCDPSATTTTTSTMANTTTSGSGTTVTTTTGSIPTTTSNTQPPGIVLKGVLLATPGRFNYNLMLGLPGANSACNTNFPGTHACTYAELQSAEAAGDLDGLKDIGNNTVTSFWAIDSSQPPLQQCQDDVTSFLNWEYGTAHTTSRGQKVALDNTLGTLGPLQSSLQCNFSTGSVGCCQ